MKEERDRWPYGLVRHLRIDPGAPTDAITAVRESGASEDGRPWQAIYYTLVLHPSMLERWPDKVNEWRDALEFNPGVGGLFSPAREASLP